MHMAWKQSGKTMWGFRYLVLFTLCLPWMAQAGSNIYYVHSDHLGTPQKLTNQSAQVVWEANHKPFGEADIDADVDGDGQVVEFNLRFQGQYYDQYTDANYNYYRDYDPTTGRYLQSDPVGLIGGLNTYSYVGSNPLRYVDPLGLDGQAAAAWANLQSGSTAYQFWDPHPEVRGKSGKYFGGRFSPKCNTFLYDALLAGGDAPSRDADGVIPRAGAWDDPNSNISGYSSLPAGSVPQVGDIVADTVSGNTHVGIYYPLPDGSDGTISAASNPQRVIHSGWGFRPENSPTVWRCDCDMNP